MEEATTLDHSEDVYEPSLTPDSLGKLGMWIFLIGDTMSFGALLAAYAAIRAGAGVIGWVPPSDILGINLTAGMTFLLICSSVTMVKALESIPFLDLLSSEVLYSLDYKPMNGTI